MSYDTYSYRHITPPAGPDTLQVYSSGSSRASRASYGSSHSSPESISVHIATPPRSPSRHNGPILLPKIRTQDQGLDPVGDTIHHRKKSSVTSNGFPIGYDPNVSRPDVFRGRSTTPSEYSMVQPRMITPDSADRLRPSMSHSRSTSTSSVDAWDFSRFAYPTYRKVPTCMTTAPAMASIGAGTLPTLAPNFQQAPKQQHLAAELVFENYAEPPAPTTLLDYLTSPNPNPQLVRRPANPNRLHDTHFWWDVRNIRRWSNFTFETIRSIPVLNSLLDLTIPAPALRTPGPANLNPDTVSQLHDTYTDFYATKVNAALKVALGHTHLTLRAQKAQVGGRQQPEFIANCESDYERTIFGDGRGRVVGLVKTFNQWNTGMRGSGAAKQIEYLRELALLHRYMREHSCRYGFLMTEVELVCVRAGTEHVPYFGLLELAEPIQLYGQGRGQMTACLALWYLHMLATNTPLPGQCGWRLDVGAPGSRTRANHLERDSWMLKPEGKEKRNAKSNRGWVFPDEPLSRKELGKPKRTSRS